MTTSDVALICKALGDPNRLGIVRMLSDGDKCGCRLLERFDITQPTLSHHMKILVECDPAELKQYGVKIDQNIHGDILDFLKK